MAGVSVIICCYNSARRISETLKYLANQNCTFDFEIILVDNNSGDETILVARTEWEKLKKSIVLKIIREERTGKTYAFQKGIEESQYDYILICDDDNWLKNDYLERGYEILKKNNSIGALGGKGIPVFESDPPLWFKSVLKDGFAVGPQGELSGDITNKGWLYGAGMFLRKDIYENLRKAGFKNNLTGHKNKVLVSGEDAEICYAIVLCGYKIWYDEKLQFYHYTENFRTSWDYALRIFNGFGAANTVLTCYKLAITKNKRLFRKFLWYYELLRLIKTSLLSFSTYKFVLNRNSINEQNLISSKRIGELSFLISNKKVFEKNRHEVISLCNYYKFF